MFAREENISHVKQNHSFLNVEQKNHSKFETLNIDMDYYQ